MVPVTRREEGNHTLMQTNGAPNPHGRTHIARATPAALRVSTDAISARGGRRVAFPTKRPARPRRYHYTPPSTPSLRQGETTPSPRESYALLLQSKVVRQFPAPEEVGELGHADNPRREETLRRRRKSKKREHGEQSNNLLRRVVALVARLLF